jgi:ubiquinone/menaquinone biosynthesis C-methylase UbiE
MIDSSALLPAAAAFDAVAPLFDERFGAWKSVDAQRRVVREVLARTFPPGTRLIEIGGGTGLDAAWLAARGRSVLLTDASPAMVAVARARLGDAAAEVIAAEQLDRMAGDAPFDGAYSNFAALNCVTDLTPVAHHLASLVRPGGQAVLVLFGSLCPGEMIVETLRGRFRNVLRRRARGDVPARLGGQEFTVRYQRRAELARVMQPWFRLEQSRAVGLFVPPSAAEPWISRHPHLLGAMETLDRMLARPLAIFGDHILYRFRRTEHPA